MKNLNLIFNKLYYEKLGQLFNGDKGAKSFDDSLKAYNNTIFTAVFKNAVDYKKSEVSKQTVILKTTYPGLLIGTGNQHGTHKSNEDINMGFSFDYVTGQPYIPGSSVKGVLRSHFKSSPEIIAEILGNLDISVKELEKEIFEENKDVFFDAVLYDGNEYGVVIGEDYITPHKDIAKNPVPIRMIKILPDVRFEFRFILNDGIVSASEKLELFSTLLQVFGLGAKTSVGYGVLEEDDLNGLIPEKKALLGKEYQPKQQRNSVQVKGAGDADGKVKCPHCGAVNHKYYKDSTDIRKKCFSCHNFLYPKR